MASWEDGAEYAPIERPDGFAMPSTAPLEQVVPVGAATPGAVAPPEAYAPAAAGVPLDRLAPSSGPTRDPRQAFDIAGSLLTADPSSHPAQASDFDPRRPMTTSKADFDPPPAAALPSGASFPPPSSAPVAPPGYLPTPAQQPSSSPTAIMQLLWVATGLLLLGFLLPSAAIILGYVAAGIVMRALPTKPRLSAMLGLSFTVALMAFWIVSDSATAYAFARVTSLIWMLVMSALALRATANRNR